MKKYSKYNEESVLACLKEGDISAFEQIYQLNWSILYSYAYNILRNKMICEEIVQETFLSLWNKREDLSITNSLKAYLLSAVKFQVLNYIRSEGVKRKYAASYILFERSLYDNSNEENMHLVDLEDLIESEVSKLSDKCQQVYRLSRNEHQSIKNIADLLNISHKTVENHLTKALKQLRSTLSGFFL
nr:RNA polymerase sigma-70 factor [Mucilaginibacter sp.]